MIAANWKLYEEQIRDELEKKYPALTVKFNERIVGRFSGVPRQVDISVRGDFAGISVLGVFDCKLFYRKIDVKTVDMMVGFADDIGANVSGLVSSSGFTTAARQRALNAKMDLRTILFTTPSELVEQFVPKLDFSDPRNSAYVVLL